jgi:hypothetical protein
MSKSEYTRKGDVKSLEFHISWQFSTLTVVEFIAAWWQPCFSRWWLERVGWESSWGLFGDCERWKGKRGKHRPNKTGHEHAPTPLVKNYGTAHACVVSVCELCIFYLRVMVGLEPAATAKLPILWKGERDYTNPRWHFTGTIPTPPPPPDASPSCREADETTKWMDAD